MMKTSQNGIKFLTKANREQIRLDAYLCSAGKWTIGYGHTKGVVPGMKITAEKAYQYLIEDLFETETVINRLNIRFTQNQFDALVSFVFNTGGPRFLGSTLLKKIRLGAPEAEIRAAFNAWKFGGNGTGNGRDDDGDGVIDEPGEKKLQPGLVLRRKEEGDLYFKL